MRRGLSLQRLHHGDRCTGIAARLKPARKTQGVYAPLATGVCRERQRLPCLRAVRFRVSGKGYYAGSIRLRTARVPLLKAAAHRSDIVVAPRNPNATRVCRMTIPICSPGGKGIMSRAVVVRADPPDPKSLPAGNPGTRIACGAIFAISGKDNDK